MSSTAASRFLEGFADIHTQVLDAADGAKQLADGASSAAAGAGDLSDGAVRLVAGQEKPPPRVPTTSRPGPATSPTGSGRCARRPPRCPRRRSPLATGARQVSDCNAKAAAAGRQVATAADALLGDLTTTRGRLADDLRAAGFTDAQVQTVLARVDTLSGPVADANATVQLDLRRPRPARLRRRARRRRCRAARRRGTSPEQRHRAGGRRQRPALDRRPASWPPVSTTRSTAPGSWPPAPTTSTPAWAGSPRGRRSFSDSLARGADSIPDPSQAQRKAMAETIGSPVAVDRDAEAAAGSYGAGLAPFFMSLALWIGGFVLFTRMRALSARALAAGQPAWRVPLGGWLGPALLGGAQAVVAFGVVALGVGIDVAHPVLLGLFMVLVSAAFLAVIHLLMARFGVVGQFMALVLMVLQLVSAGGTFPWQTLPGPLHPLHHVLPMSYAVDGVRRLMYGGPTAQLGLDVAVIGAWGVGALLLGALAARRAGTWTAARVQPESCRLTRRGGPVSRRPRRPAVRAGSRRRSRPPGRRSGRRG